MSQVDGFAASRSLIDNAFSHLTWFEDVCEQTGFKGVSQIWRENPAWYFWHKLSDGAFLLRLHADESFGDFQYLSFSLHYFPNLKGLSNLPLSPEEKTLLEDDQIFHRETCTPHFETYHQVLDYFVVAEIGCAVNADNELELILFSTRENEEHPAFLFFDLLVTALNFQAKRHHQKAYSLAGDSVATIFLSYSKGCLNEFLQAFEVEPSQIRPVIGDSLLKSWERAAHMEADCSANGTCSCSH